MIVEGTDISTTNATKAAAYCSKKYSYALIAGQEKVNRDFLRRLWEPWESEINWTACPISYLAVSSSGQRLQGH